ncbi:MAG: hypothetical protein KBC90_17150 [Spirochaetes bacterium]|nr:hypothetical protein [Spirochaetota bacterium]
MRTPFRYTLFTPNPVSPTGVPSSSLTVSTLKYMDGLRICTRRSTPSTSKRASRRTRKPWSS